MIEATIELTDLPKDILRRVADYLKLLDAVRFCSCSKTMHDTIPLVTLQPPIPVLGITHMKGEMRDKHRIGAQIPILLGSRNHTIVLKSTWKDQGWGNAKGLLLVTANDDDASEKDIKDFSKARLVTTSPTAPHTPEPCWLSFRPKQGEIYHLWVLVGGGGGHTLDFTTPVIMHSVIFDEEDRPISRAFSALQKATNTPAFGMGGVDEFWLDLLRGAAQSLLAQVSCHTHKEEDSYHGKLPSQSPDPFLSTFLQSHGFPMDRKSLEALIDLCSTVTRTITKN